jgi:hypothetical protein
MQTLSQLDKRWAHKTIGNTQYLIGRWGCTITSMCMLISQFHNGLRITPPEAAKKWAFTQDASIIWGQSNFEFMKFLKRGYGANHEEIAGAAESDHQGVILEVNRSHWIVVEGVENGNYVIHDPIDGTRHVGIPSKYYITGYALFEAVQVDVEIPAWGVDAVEAAMRHGIDQWQNPHEPINPQMVEWIMQDLGADKVLGGSQTKLEFIVNLHRLGVFN